MWKMPRTRLTRHRAFMAVSGAVACVLIACCVVTKAVRSMFALPGRSSLDRTELLGCFGVSKFDNHCVRILSTHRNQDAGLGHQISELLFSLRFSQLLKLTPHIAPFKSRASSHGEDYSFANTLLGLNAISSDFEISAKLRQVDISRVSASDCNVVVTTDDSSCVGSKGNANNCFASPTMSLNFDRAKRCLQEIAKVHGSWLERNPYETPNAFNVLWHVRVGDENLHPPGDNFYENVLLGLRDVLEDFVDVRHRFIGSWHLLDSHDLAAYKTFISRVIPSPIFITKDVEQTLLHMMHADLLIGSGSSMTSVAALFSAKPLYVNSEPQKAGQKGWGFLGEYFPDGLTVDANGTLLHHVPEIRSRYRSATIRRKLKADARTHYFV